MAGMKLLTKHDARACLKIAYRTAQDMGYSLTPLDDNSKRFTASSGNALFSALHLAPHCNFQISVETYSDTNELVLEKNAPWFTSGAIGISRVHARATELLDAIASAIEKDGGTIHERREF